MHRIVACLALISLGLVGCAKTKRWDAYDPPRIIPEHASSEQPAESRQVSYIDDEWRGLKLAVEEQPIATESLRREQKVLGLEELEQIALENNPVIREARARVNAAQGQWIQQGLGTNPNLGWQSNEIGNDGASGQHGLYLGKLWITGGKLALAQQVAARDIALAEQNAYLKRLQVFTDVRLAYYRLLVLQRREAIAQEFLEIADEAVQVIGDLLASGQAARVELLQAEVEAEQTRIILINARNEEEAARRRLAAIIGTPEELRLEVSEPLEELPAERDFEATLAMLQTESPEVISAISRIERARWALQRAFAQVTPNINTQLGAAYDDSSRNTFGAVQVTVPMPIRNRNQGAIRAARAELVAAELALSRVELDLQRRLANAYANYANATAQIVRFDQTIIPKATESLELVSLSYVAGEVPYVSLLTAQRTLFTARLDRLEALSGVWSSAALIDGMLLSGSLNGQ